ncbi:hypothetical protein Cni_G26234 [Canna indica]|uniref:Uncharacterized protein n=1 Tax=Canna indica TaxID=4628 RepID=A0AAQ3KYM1_9LILI|nr:hypothetical protein Cni_G26234 [Canna indica]
MIGEMIVDNVTKENDIAPSEVSKEDIKSKLNLVSSKGSDECLKKESEINNNFLHQEAIKCRDMNAQAECSDTNSQIEKSKSDSRLSQGPLQRNPECEVSAGVEDDVEVCDICGDAGIE